MSVYDLILKEIKDYVEKCRKPKSSSNVLEELPWDFDIELDVREHSFRENNIFGNMFTNIGKRQAELQDRESNFSEKEEAYLEDYFHNGYQWINGLIYDSPSFYGNFTNKLIREYGEGLPSAIYNLDKAIAKGVPLRQKTVLWTSIRINEDLEKGEVGSWKGYVSTSFDEEQIMVSGRKKDYKVKILAMEGVKGVCGNGKTKYTNKQNDGFNTLSLHSNENEYLLGRNTKYLMIDKNTETREATVLVF